MSVSCYMHNKDGEDVEIPNDAISDIAGQENLADRIIALYEICPRMNGNWDRNKVDAIVKPGWKRPCGTRVAKFKAGENGKLKRVKSDDVVDAVINSKGDLYFIVQNS